MRRAFLVLMLAGLMGPVFACPAKRVPQEDKLESYKTIFNGEIVGVELTQYQADIKACIKSGKTDPCSIMFSDVEPYEVTVAVGKVFKGNESKLVTLQIAACGAYPPKVHYAGMFFVSDDGYVIPLYSDEQLYYYWFYKFNGLKNPEY